MKTFQTFFVQSMRESRLLALDAPSLPQDGRDIRLNTTYRLGSSAQEAREQARTTQDRFQSRTSPSEMYNRTRDVTSRYMATTGQNYQRQGAAFVPSSSVNPFSGPGGENAAGYDQVLSFGSQGPRRAQNNYPTQPLAAPGQSGAGQSGQMNFTRQPGETSFSRPEAANPTIPVSTTRAPFSAASSPRARPVLRDVTPPARNITTPPRREQAAENPQILAGIVAQSVRDIQAALPTGWTVAANGSTITIRRGNQMISGELSRSNRITFISQGTSRVAAEYPGEVRNQFLAWINQANESATKRGRNRTT